MIDGYKSQHNKHSYPTPIPQDSRYVPFTQQQSCCVPTCIQMIMYRNDIPLRPAEEIGYHLGLVVSPENSKLFANVRTSTEMPSTGYGIRLHMPEYEPKVAFAHLNIPLHFAIEPIKNISSADELLEKLRTYEKDDIDVMVVFNLGALLDDPTLGKAHHACVFDRVLGEQVRLIDPSVHVQKWRTFDAAQLFKAMKEHVSPEYGGMWILTKTNT